MFVFYTLSNIGKGILLLVLIRLSRSFIEKCQTSRTDHVADLNWELSKFHLIVEYELLPSVGPHHLIRYEI